MIWPNIKIFPDGLLTPAVRVFRSLRLRTLVIAVHLLDEKRGSAWVEAEEGKWDEGKMFVVRWRKDLDAKYMEEGAWRIKLTLWYFMTSDYYIPSRVVTQGTKGYADPQGLCYERHRVGHRVPVSIPSSSRTYRYLTYK